MRIHESSNVPNGTYFTQTDVEPRVLEDGSIRIYDGKGDYRSSWGAPSVTSTVVVNEDDFAVIHVGYNTKHAGGQQWYYYTTDGEQVERITWRQIPDETRQRILDAAKQFAPRWAKVPGKLSTERKAPQLRTRRSFKLVRMMDGQMVSIYDGETVYEVGKRLMQKAEAGHRGGWYSHPTQRQVMALWRAGDLVPDDCVVPGAAYALIECEIGGTIVEYSNGKLASTYLTPLRVVETFVHQPAAMAA